MKLFDIILLSLAAAFLLIGIYEIIKFGVGQGYWSVMISVAFFFFYTYRKKG